MADNSKCVVLIPVGNILEPETDNSLRILANRGYIVRMLRGSSQVDLARSTMATEALMDGFEETMWVDADIGFEPDDVDRLRSHNLPFCVGLYVQKGPKRFAGMFPADTGKVKFGKGGTLIRMDYVGFGFTYVRAEVYRAIEQALPLGERSVMGGYQGKMVTPYFRPLIAAHKDGPTYLSEDYSYTLRARESGFVPMADTTIRLEHIGRKKYTWDDLTYTPERLESLEIELGATDWKFPTDVRGWLTDEEGAGLAMLARGKDVLEVGSYCGRSSICLGQTAKSLCCVDPFDCRDTPGEGDTFDEFDRNLKRYEVKAKVFRNLFSEAPLNGDRFDLAFIDGAHDEASVEDDAQRATALLKPGGLLAFHDARPRPGHHDGGWHPGVTNTVNRLIAAGAELIQTVGTVAVLRPSEVKMKGVDIAFLKGEVVRLEQRHLETVQSAHEIAGALTYARNLLAHAEQQTADAAKANDVSSITPDTV
jgi:predicted O-methyltransferase YrrM